ncbi:hypothetical protein [Polynucleobacter necessarius]|uniref:hypothetical protein n=1 Tax=Polynucleobacter necessarius TaxID=576610 RepID=UPI0013B06A7D|nr:hypothetical protein [Polynucleobacter necessarius]
MRRICMFLCLSLFVSLIHVGSIPASIEKAGQAHAQHIVKHDCHPQADSKMDKSHTTNHQTHHQCCVGVVANLSTSQYIQPDFSNHFISLVSQLIVEADPNHIFKPPRQIS